MTDYRDQIKKTEHLIKVYEAALCKIRMKLETARNGDKLKLQKLASQHEASIASYQRQISAYKTILRNQDDRAQSRRISDYETHQHDVEREQLSRIENVCDICGGTTVGALRHIACEYMANTVVVHQDADGVWRAIPNTGDGE